MSGLDWRTLRRIVTVSLLGVVVGGLASVAAVAFVEAVELLNGWLLVSPYARIQYETRPLLVGAATVLVPVAGGLVVGLLVRHFVAGQRGLGPPDSIIAVQTGEAPPSARCGAGSTLAALVSLGCGASVGQYGPLVYLGTLIGGLAGRLNLAVENLQAIGIASGVAAAIATAFNAPIAGLVFAHEVVLRHYSLRAFAPVTVAAATGYVVANVILERPPLFLVRFDGVAHAHEFLLFALEGVLSAFLATGFVALLGASGRLARRVSLPLVLRPAAAGLVLGVVALEVPEVLGMGKETLRFATIEGAFRLDELALITAAKVGTTALCIGFGFVGGVFSPALLIGILFGALFGSALPLVPGLATSGVVVYAICGMMAVTSPVIGAPLTTILIVFELTRNYDLTVAAMVAVVFANLLAHRVVGRSVFDRQLKARGFDFSLGRDKAILGSRRVADYLTTACTVVPPGIAVADLHERLHRDGRAEAHIVDRDGRHRGLVRLQDTVEAAPDTPADTLAGGGGVTFTETTSVWDAMQQVRGFVGEAVPLVAGDGRFLGVVPEEAVIRAYEESVYDLRREENESA